MVCLMGSFDDAVNRELYARKQAADDVAARTNARRRASVRAAEELSVRLRELADYLARHTSPRSVEIRPAGKW